MENIFELALLFDFYGSLLTEKQQVIFDMYYNQDFSLQEISDELSISRQTVFDTIKRCKVNLYAFEEKLSLVNRHLKIKDEVKRTITYISDVCENVKEDSTSYNKLIETIRILQNID